MQDARRSLATVRDEWNKCTRCELGPRRMAYDGELVFGEGMKRGVMFVGDSPDKDEEISGRPFTGQTGRILRRVIDKLGLRQYYLTNSIACRSCVPFTDAAGNPSMRKNWKTKQMEISYRDDPPTPIHIASCLPRLYEEIYLVDPVIIVTLGAPAAKSLIKQHVSTLNRDVRGNPFHISIPGAGARTVRTEKKEAWVRTQHGKIQLPIEQSEVRYLCIPTHDLEYVRRKLADQGDDSIFKQFVSDIQKAVQVYERYMLELYGTVPTGLADAVPEFTDEEVMGPAHD